MQIKELVEKLNPVKVNYCGKENIEVKNIAQDSRNPKGTVFFAYKGESYDSNKDAENIYKRQLSEKGMQPLCIISPELAEYIAKLILDEGRSPAKIINMLQENPKYAVVPKSSATIYNAIDNGLIPGVTRENLNSDITTVFNDGQIHIAKWVRNALKIKDGDKLSFEVVNNKIIFSKANEQS